MNMKQKKIKLIAVAGTTPQIVTETLFHLLLIDKQKVEEIIVLTTEKGAEILKNTIQKENIIFKLYEEYGLSTDSLPVFTVEKLMDNNNKALADVRNNEENICAAKHIINFIRDKAADMDSRLHCSLAGGRKTMRSYMALAMNLFGREQDELSHVLVYPAEIENNKNFYFPHKNEKDIRIDLARIPFIRLRDKIESLFGDLSMLSFEDMLNLCNSDVETLVLKTTAKLINEQYCLYIRWGDRSEYTLKMEPKLFSIYRFLYENKDAQELSDNKDLSELYGENYGHGLDAKFDMASIRRDVSKINNQILKKELPNFLFSLFQIKPYPDSKRQEYYIPFKFENRIF